MKKKQQMAAIPGNVKQLLKFTESLISNKESEKKFEKLKKKFVKPAIKISSRKGKSRVCQNWTAKKISELTGIEWGKDECIAPREMGQCGVDIRLVADAKEQFPWSVECKNSESWSLPSFIQQAKTNQLPGTDWLLILKKKGSEYVVVLDAEVFFDILRLIKGKRGR